ncbi:uncharacterized protein LOC124282945 [Haliotis rubra]|uniref:uncharacterized protein LOC124282945 n=1 Tax=Haliotis rubra TaxID=36100 RepID=UPI001EE5906D|nr:uncharacterized protein LOC124282945 [Haliotis rubra]
MTKVSAPERPIDEWADDVKPSFVIQGLVDSFGPGCKEAKDCTCCRGEGETTPATVWCSACDDALCEACARAHRRFQASRHHDVLDLSGSEVNISRRRKVMCIEHKDECIKFLCKDCEKVTCHICCVIYHRKCESVVTLESELPALKSQLLNKKETISKKQLQMEAKVDVVTVNIISAKHRYGKMEEDIKSFGTKAREKIKQMENILLDELKDVPEIEQLAAGLKTGEISEGLKAAPVSQDTGNVRVAGDLNEVYVSDVTVLMVHGSDTAVVTDTYNNSVKSFYTWNKQRGHSKLKLEGAPLGVTRLSHDQVAVTVPNISQIVTVRSNPGLVLMSTITTIKQYRGITCLTPSTLAAGSERCVDILDMTGNVLRSISPVDSEEEIIHGPDFLCTTRTDNILVSDDSSGRVLCLTAEGDVVFTYPATGHTTLRSTCGITSTSTGDILVTDYGEHTVAHLTESGQFQNSSRDPSRLLSLYEEFIITLMRLRRANDVEQLSDLFGV